MTLLGTSGLSRSLYKDISVKKIRALNGPFLSVGEEEISHVEVYNG